MTAPRRPSVAGRFYPAGADDLVAGVDRLLAAAAAPTDDQDPVALVVPHAGHACSGPVAATAYRWLPAVPSVAVLGPAHSRDPGGLAVPECDTWHTPLGPVPIDTAACDALVAGGPVHRSDWAHQREHSLEVQLPFLQRRLREWRLVPVVAGAVPPDIVADCLDVLADAGAFPVISTDLSHYLDDAAAREVDRQTVAAVLGRDADGVGDRDACGAVVLRGLLAWTRRHDRRIELLDLGTSADTCSGPDRVVGYGAFAVL